MKRKELVEYLIEQGGKEESGYTWSELLNMFDLEINSYTLKRASDWWRYYKRTGKTIPEIEEIEENYAIVEEEEFIPDMKLRRLWITPEGKVGRSYERATSYDFSEEDILYIKDQIKHLRVSPQEVVGSSTGIISLADLHAGAITKTFSLEKLQNYLEYISSIINSYGYEKTVLLFPGDLIESFTGLNHKDTWKNIESFGSELIITTYTMISKFLNSINNLSQVVFVEGNHDRVTEVKESNYREGAVRMLSFFLQQNSDIEIIYDPFMVSLEIDNIFYIITHGDVTPYKKGKDYGEFLFKYGKQNIYNVIISGHSHEYAIPKTGESYMHVQCPSLVSGHFFAESTRPQATPGFVVIENRNNKPKVIFEPL